ncbi:uncharacterized protein LOC132196011 [Neocloeon triangulifer]|uniref:uncharacterized protein LOC132196011 n=1 Tax=Neocloeon triangulifer TaxID=2078957 RepID=UPI00286F489F|nr:uncharacterized protein LOC132196011 [Neocloeon triangulifer]
MTSILLKTAIFAALCAMVNGQNDSATDCSSLDFSTIPKTCCSQPYGELLPLSKIQGAQACKATAAMMNWVNTYQLNNLQSKDIKNFIDDKSKSYLSTICTPATVVNCIFGANDFVNSSGSINIQNLKAFLSTNAPNTTWGNIMNTILDPMNSDYNTAYQFTDIVEDNFEKVVCPTGNVNLLPIIMMQMLQSEIIWMCPKQAVYDTKNKCSETMKNFQYCDGKIYSNTAKGIFFFPNV